MLNNSGIVKTTGVNTQQILFDAINHKAVGVVVSSANKTEADDVNGHKILRAGTPLTGDLKARETAFTKANPDGTDVVGVLLHDVDLGVAGSEVDANGTLLIWGFVNMDRVSSKAQGLLVSAVEKALAGRVTLLK